MEHDHAHQLTFRPATEKEIHQALPWALRAVASASRDEQIEAIAADLQSGSVPRDGLLVACRSEAIVGAILAQVHPGRSAVLWPPGIAPHEPFDTSRLLLAACMDWLANRSLCVAQVVLETVTPEDAALLETQGFHFLAHLLYLGCVQSAYPVSPPTGPLEFEPCAPASHQRLARIVEATYQRTLDCPGLDNVRDVQDVLAGYRAAGTFQANYWLIVRHANQDVGALLLADYPKQGNLELVYMGLIPSVRGRAWGRHLVHQTQWLARQAGRPRVVLAVDAANRPAINMYTACGFEAWDRRTVYLKVFQDRPSPCADGHET